MAVFGSLRRFVNHIPFKIKLFAIPFLATVMLLGVTFIQKEYAESQYNFMHSVTKTEIDVLKKINLFESELSAIFGKIHDLIISAGNRQNGDIVDEEYVYIHGKPLIYKLHRQKNHLHTVILPQLDARVDAMLLDRLQAQFGKYLHHASSAITMVSVDLELAGQQAANASTYYNLIIKDFDSIRNQLIESSERTINARLDSGIRKMQAVTMILIGFIILMIIMGAGLSRQLSGIFESIFIAINRLSKGERDFELPSFKDNSELQKISMGLQIFKDNIIKIERLHKQTLSANIRLKREIEERKKAQTQMMLSDKVFENAAEAIVITDKNNRIMRVNRAFSDITGYSKEEAYGKDPGFHKSDIHDDSFYEDMWQAIENSKFWQGEIINRKKNGDIWPSWSTISMIEYEGEHYYVSVSTDISTIKESRKEIEFLAYHDTLTSLPNRLLFSDRVEHAIARSKRTKEIFAILFLDLDKFKYINDTMGHHVGDILLIEVTKRLKNVLRPEDTISRFGGDEFLILIEAPDSLDDIRDIGERVLESFQAPFMLDGKEIVVSVSIGVSFYPEDADTADMLIKNADLAMYKAKNDTKNSFEFYTSSLSASMKKRFDLEHELRSAFSKKELKVFYQPQIDLSVMKPDGAEALIRWKHPKHGWISPAIFIPIAEDTGLIHEIGLFVFEECCAQIADWKQKGFTGLKISINLSVKQFYDEKLADTLQSILLAYNVDAGMIELEITESHMMENQFEIIEQMKALREIGFKLSIDDFGTGYSSLSVLKNLPINRLKIDRSFIRDITENEDDRIIVLTIIAMGSNLGLNVIAEGVETKEQLEMLKLKGCHGAQGYLFSHAMDARSFLKWFNSYL
ncbi:MAG: hypothetical protein B5M52_07105 [Helicobacteraceae bacterium 4484_230]|nr:MAG: hypothetical protein B5M52_07105 [Helicobacteraceae bacterium 4484_230]